MKDTYDFTYAGDLRHFIGVLLDDYCPTQLKIFDSDIVHIPQELRIRSRGTERHSASN